MKCVLGSGLGAGAVAGISLCTLVLGASAGIAATAIFMKRRYTTKKGNTDDRLKA